MYSWHTHPAKRKNIVLRARPGGKGRTEKNGFQEGKRPTIIGTEKVNDTFGSSKFPLQLQEGACFPPREWPSNYENMDPHKQEMWIKWLPKPKEDVKVNEIHSVGCRA